MTSRKNIFIISGILGILTIIMIISSVFLFNEVVGASRNLLAEKQKIVISEKEFSELESFEARYDDYKSNLDKIEQLFISVKAPVVFIEFLEKIALGNNLELDMSIPSVSQDGSTSLMSFQFSLIGNFSDIIRFTKIIENSPYLIKVGNINVKKYLAPNTDKKNISSVVRADFSVQALAK